MTGVGASARELEFVRPPAVSEEGPELEGVIHDYRAGLVPLVVPITLLRHHLRRLGQDYLEEQAYLRPHPHELMLLNRV